MLSKNQKILLQQAGQFLEALREGGLSGEMDLDSLREYQVKVIVREGSRILGKTDIYYKPSRNLFTMKPSGIKDPRITATLEKAWHNITPGQQGDKIGKKSGPPAPETLQGVHLYVDGSFLRDRIGFGVVILRDGKLVKKINGAVNQAASKEHRQVAGEIKAVEEGIRWCLANGISEVSVWHDYAGLEKWVSGEYRSNIPLTKNYRRFMEDSGLVIHWHKVKSHTGDYWNEYADRLAREGAGSGTAREGAAGDESLEQELRSKTEAFTAFLKKRGIDAVFLQIYNHQYARVQVNEEGRRAGFLTCITPPRKDSAPTGMLSVTRRWPSAWTPAGRSLSWAGPNPASGELC